MSHNCGQCSDCFERILGQEGTIRNIAATNSQLQQELAASQERVKELEEDRDHFQSELKIATDAGLEVIQDKRKLEQEITRLSGLLEEIEKQCAGRTPIPTVAVIEAIAARRKK